MLQYLGFLEEQREHLEMLFVFLEFIQWIEENSELQTLVNPTLTDDISFVFRAAWQLGIFFSSLVCQRQTELENVICSNEMIYSYAILSCVNQANKESLIYKSTCFLFHFIASQSPRQKKNEPVAAWYFSIFEYSPSLDKR